MLTVNDIMTVEPFSVTVEDNLADVEELFLERGVRHAPVVDPSGDLVGLVTHRDLTRIVLHRRDSEPVSAVRHALRTTRVGDVMTADPVLVGDGTTARAAGELMLARKIGCLPVVRERRLVGIVTESDYVRYVVEQSAG